MPLLGHERPHAPLPIHYEAGQEKTQTQARIPPARRQSQHSEIAKTAIMSNFNGPVSDNANNLDEHGSVELGKSSRQASEANLAAPKPAHAQSLGTGACLTDTPATTAPNSPKVSPKMYAPHLEVNHACQR